MHGSRPPLHRRRPVVVLLALLVGCGGAPASAPVLASAGTTGAIEWVPWSAQVFERARAEHRMVLVDVGIEGCTACRWMYEDTYQDPAVIARVSEHFIAVAVDADLRPDLGERYAAWGWPATIVLSPNGTQVHAIRGNSRPRNFLPVLDTLIRRQRDGSLESDADAPIERPPAESGELTRLCADGVGGLDRAADVERGGFGRRMRIAVAAPFRWALARARAREETERTQFVVRSLDGYAQMIDPAWGGIYVAAGPDFDGVIPEKRIIHQGPMMAAFAEASLATGDTRLTDRALEIERYLREWMRAADGTYYATQEDDAPRLPAGMDARAYFGLDDEGRREFGVPPIDHAVYTDLNALVIEGYVRLYEATRDEAHLHAATTAAEALLSARQRSDGLMAQTHTSEEVSGDDRMRRFEAEGHAFLEPQGPFGLALLALHSATGEGRWLDAARRIAAGLPRLQDQERGSYFASDDATTASWIERRHPLGDNVSAARFLLRLSWATHDDSLRARAEEILRAIHPGTRITRMGTRASNLVRTLEELSDGPVEFTVVGDADDPAARALFAAGVHLYEPRKVVHFEAAGVRYPDQGHAAVFICTNLACSSPVSDPAAVRATALRMARVADGSSCGGRERAGAR